MSIRKVVPISEADWRVGCAPEWVETREPDWNFEAPEEYGVAILLADEQHHVPTQAVSNRTVRRVLTRAAVQALGQVEIDFDPAAERLLIHDLVIWRQDSQGRWQNRSVAQTQQFLVRQREEQLEQQMLNGRASVVALVEDLRVGDAIDLSWSVEPRDPLPDLRFTAFHGFAWTVPVGTACFTLHLSPQTPVFWKLHTPEKAEPPAHESSPNREHWRQDRPPVNKFEPNAPPGRWNFPLLEASAWPDWGAVAACTASLWADALSDAPEQIREAVERLRVPGNLARSVSEAIRFVQGEIRYLAVDFGHGSGLLPNGAGTVLRRRFGDCKDKTVLLTALLRALGGEAWPLLVNPAWSKTLVHLHPSLGVFNHVIVTFVIDGQRYFVDPTFVGQRGDLPHLIPPPFRWGLEIGSGATELTPIPPWPEAELTLTETFHLDRKQRNGSVEQVLEATGWLADEIRGAIARSGEAAFFKSGAEALQNHFPALLPDEQSGVVHEDPASNAIQVKDRHLMPTWGPKGEKPPPLFSYGAHGLFLAVEKLEPPEERTLPWALRHPLRVKHRVVVRGRCVRRTKAEKHRHSGPGFRYACDVTSARRQVAFDYLWETTGEEISAEAWPDYCRERQKALEHAGANVVTQSAWRTLAKSNWAYIGLVALGVTAGIAGGIRDDASRHRREVEMQVVESQIKAASEAVAQGDFATAEPVFEQFRDLYPKNANFHFLRAEVAIHMNRLDRARQALETARKLDPGNPLGDLLAAQICRAHGDLKSAKSLLDRLATRFPSDARIYRDLAVTYGQLGDKPAAREAWGQVLALAPANPVALNQYALLLWESGEQARADAMIAGALAVQPKPNASFEALAGDYYLQTGRSDQAVERLEQAYRLAPADGVRASAAVLANLKAGRLDRAATLAADMKQRFSSHPSTWHAASLVACAAGNSEAASAAFQEWLHLAPRDPVAHANYGHFLHRAGRIVEAREVLARATSLFPGEGLVWLNYAALLESLGENASATEARQKAHVLLTSEQRRSLIP